MAEFLKALAELFFGLVPDQNATPEQRWRWYRRIGRTTAVLLLVVIVLTYSILVAYGALTSSLVQPFVRQHDMESYSAQFGAELGKTSTQVTQVEGQLSTLLKSMGDDRVERLRTELTEERRSECEARGAAKIILLRDLGDLINRYDRVSGENYQPPPCQDL